MKSGDCVVDSRREFEEKWMIEELSKIVERDLVIKRSVKRMKENVEEATHCVFNQLI